MITEKAKYRVKVLSFWEKHGLQATIDAFDHKERTLYLWKKKLKEGNGKLESLNEKSRKPHNIRKRNWSEKIINEIKRLRKEHPNLGKDKINKILKEFCLKNALERPGKSTIGRIIKDCGGLRSFPKKVSHFGKVKKIKRKKVLRKPKNFKPQYPGHLIAMDTIEKNVYGSKRYIITFEDIYTRICFAWATNSHASLAAKEFFEYCLKIFPYPMENMLTDNGSEFKKHFNQKINELHMKHYHTYPKCPRMNSHCERFNRTIQEEFVDYHVYDLLDLDTFNRQLKDWLVWYNIDRPHFAFANEKSPLEYALSLNINSFPKNCNFGWTHTQI
jgi:transposase InsO family protein